MALLAPPRLRVVHLSDTHQYDIDAAVRIPDDTDLIIHTGDFSNHGSPEEFDLFNQWLGRQRCPNRVVVLGNHDVRHYGDDFATMSSLLTNATLTPVFSGFDVPFPGVRPEDVPPVRMWGAPWHYFQDWRYNHKPGFELVPTRYPELPEGTEVFLTHGPKWGVLDEADNHPGNFSGSPELAHFCSLRRPALHLHGHIHEMWGSHVSDDGLATVNSALCDWRTTRLAHSVHVIDLTREPESGRLRVVATPH